MCPLGEESWWRLLDANRGAGGAQASGRLCGGGGAIWGWALPNIFVPLLPCWVTVCLPCTSALETRFFSGTDDDAGKIGFCHYASVLQAQVPKLCTDLDFSLLYILILGTCSKFARKINFLALGVYCPAGQGAFRRSRSQLKLGEEIESSRLVDD